AGRRSTRSTQAPNGSPKSRLGVRPRAAARPRSSAEPVSRRTSSASTNVLIELPNVDTVCPDQNHQKSALGPRSMPPSHATPAAAALVAFAALVAWHGRLARRHRRADLRRRIAEEALLRLARDWDGLAACPGGDAPVPGDHPYAADLDVTGRASLLRLLDTT